MQPCLQLDIEALTSGIENPGFKRQRQTIGKKSRIIDAPNGDMRKIHKRLLEQLRPQRSINRHETAGPGSSTLKHIEPHRGNRYVVTYDLRNAYQRVRGQRLIELFVAGDTQLNIFGDEVVAAFIRKHCLLPGGVGLPTGAPASQELFNLYVEHMLDFNLARICARYGITYTRYIDDLTFSSNEVIGKQKRRRIREAIRSAGFTIARSKAKVVDLKKESTIQITGILLDREGNLALPEPVLRRFETTLRKALRGEASRSQVDGCMGYFWMVYREADKPSPRAYRVANLQMDFKDSVIAR